MYKFHFWGIENFNIAIEQGLKFQNGALKFQKDISKRHFNNSI